ncbi:type I DNA topoisomerase [Desulfosarcina ovata]|uniref:DNA topoisomerase 1 n=1 Tax=Desulfosarcina ovata subsp. ovata TaxID=2752305 RepID=A0A5K8A9A5_9BACT|nr:type I DNA topoisomerase [Desulfosarcina ovata]BBO89018.1 DNA topoisomerase 1 [Desulfosarcina ovata subsp. ovata]
MSKPLVIVESPTKVRTIKKYLGNDYNVAATVGHIKDLPSKNLGIDIEKDFTPQYRTIPGKSKVLSQLKSAAGDTTDIYLAPDPDREGEAIAWHTAEVLKKKGRRFHRVLFHELTKKAILESMQAAQDLDRHKYEAQQARRILDRLVGYQISPLLWRKVKGGLSAGRVQSVSVRIICDRERAIQAFEPVEYWSITASLKGSQPPAFDAKLARKNGKKIEIPDEAAATAILRDLENAPFVLDKIVKRTTRRNPLPPFITSKLQQEAIRKLRFSAKKAMMIAQQLYEGIDLGPGEPVGLITYMRTDSTRIADEAAQEALQLITERFGPNYSNGKPRFFKNKNKAQDAHEAIRPTSVYHTPEKLKPYLSKDQMALYTMIWQRFMASQMAQALIDQKTLSIVAGDYTFTASGSSVKFAGFLAVYQSADDDAERSKGSQTLPELEEKSVLTPLGIVPKQHFTQPPPRFSEASLVKELEENGIGRPSTYAAILSTIRDKGYVELLKGYFRPTELGFIVNDLLIASFPEILDVEFTARMENDLDRVEQAEVESLAILNQFYGPFSKKLAEAVEGMLSVKGVGMPTGLTCPLCKKNPLRIKMGKNGHFLACSGYPECTYSSDYERDEKGVIAPVAPVQSEATDKVCDKCGKPMVIKRGRYGDFLACSGYPECKHTQSLNGGGSAKATGVPCPQPGCDGEIVEKSSKRGKIFYGCNRYPECSFASWDKPVAKACPACGNAYMVEKTTKRDGTMIVCPNRECKHKEPAGEGDGK